MLFENDSLIDSEIEKINAQKELGKTTARKAFRITLPIGIALGVLVFYFSLGTFFYFVVVLILCVPLIIKSYLNIGLISNFKEKIVASTLSKIYPKLTYSPAKGMSQSAFESANLFDRADRYKGEDLVEGMHKKTAFSFSEVHAEAKQKTKNGTSYSTIFKGLFMVADFNKHIKNETYVLTSGGKWFSKFKRVKLENPVFENNFNVYSDNQVEARYILTPALMEKIIGLEEKYNSQLYMSFIKTKVYIALKTTHNYFEPDLSDEVSKDTLREAIREIEGCIGIIDELDLNTRIWTKE